jgi:hypothetical protein
MGFAEMMTGMAGGGDFGSKKPICGDALKTLRETFVPIEGLKEGDKVQWKGKEYVSCKIPQLGQTVEVLHVFTPLQKPPKGGNHDLDRDDFSVAFLDEDGEMQIFAFDSRNFKRVE